MISLIDKNVRLTFCTGGNVSGIIGEKGDLKSFYTGVNVRISLWWYN